MKVMLRLWLVPVANRSRQGCDRNPDREPRNHIRGLDKRPDKWGSYRVR